MNNREFWLAFAGLVSTALVSIVGLFLNHRARNAPFRESLYERQLDLMVRILAASGQLRDELIVLFDHKGGIGEHDAIWHRVRGLADKLAVLAPEAVTLLPSAVYSRFAEMHQDVLDILRRIAYDALPRQELDRILDRGLAFANAARVHLGTDSLSVETQRAFSKHAAGQVTSMPLRAPEAV